MTAQPFSHPIRISELRRTGGAEFDLRPDSAARAEIAEALGVTSLRKVRFAGKVVPEGRHDWHLEAQLGATVVQPCVVTLAPVTTRIDEPVQRRWLKEMPEVEGDEVEMPDDALEPLGMVIDLGTVLVEALALSVPDWPRAADAPEGEEVIEGAADPALDDDTHRPFAGLGALRDRLAGEQPEGDDTDSEAPDTASSTGGRKS
jgi:uncharacterized metal-binding protein YceD (DUF177 family)